MMDTVIPMISTVTLLGLLALNAKMLAHYWPRISEVMHIDTQALHEAVEASEAALPPAAPVIKEKRRIKGAIVSPEPLIQRSIASYPMPQWAIG